ncbi:MAG: cytochrome ubiquinol oxidase subunit I [Chloroflexi bacterium]|nr:cytochrome ubiquinol oxidase subunit I [Chloroflexota bacterium]
MTDLFAARAQMALSLGFHMIFAAVGMAMPIMMLLAEGHWLRTGDPAALRLANTWAKVTAVLFAIGAISGTALAFELGLLWPRFMAFSGPLIGLAFALEGYAFFIEAIFLGLYLYDWTRLRPLAHWLCGWPVALSGAASGILVVSADAWMQSPVGFALGLDGRLADVDPLAALFNPAWGLMAFHSTLATHQAVGFAAAGVYAWALLRDRRPERAAYNRLALTIALLLATPAAVAQPVLGDLLARRLVDAQPAKLAALEGQFATERGAPLRIGGWPDPEARQTRGAIEVPKALSLLATHDPNGQIVGLAAFPRDEWPEPRVVHPAFQIMVGAGFATLGVALWYWWAWWRARGRGGDWASHRRLLRALTIGSPLGFVALEAGWVVTEVGRQPWTIYGLMRTRDAVTVVQGVWISLAGFTALYLALGVAVVLLLRRMAATSSADAQLAEEATPDAGG